MSFRQPRYIEPADPNVVSKAIMKATSEGFQTYNCRKTGACGGGDDDDGKDKEDKDPKPNSNTTTTTNIYNNYYRKQ